jgi:3-methyladenine DNA glycosylase/8-oxoguanine DNA glycosylase
VPTRSLSIDEPFDLRATLRTTDVGIWRDGIWWWPVWGEDAPSTLALAPANGRVEAEAWGPSASTLLERLPALLGAEQGVPEAFPGSPAERFLRRARGLRLGASGDLHGALVSTILGQVVTTTEAAASLRGLVGRFGEPAPGPLDGLRALPGPAVIAGLGHEDLHPLGVERRRADVVIEVARRWPRIAPLVDGEPSHARRVLESIRGVGPWTSANVVGAAMGAADEVPVGDYHLPNRIAWALAGEERGNDARMLELLEPYRPVRRRVLVAVVQSGIHAPRRGPRRAIRRHL